MNKSIWKKSANIFVCGLLGAAILVAGCGDNKTSAAVHDKPAVKTEQQLSAARNTPIVAAAKKVGPAVVGITNKAYVRDFFNRTQLMERGTGSGVIYDKAGYIATNNHVVEGASEIIVSLPDGRTVKGKVLGADAVTDLAVVKIDADNLTVATFGDSDTLQVGEPAIAIGNPLGLEFRGSVTAGVISALNRSVSMTNEETGDTQESGVKLIQTDAAINEGNSGGALVNVNGEVIGINSSKLVGDSVEGIGYAIPISDVGDLIENLMNRETKTKVAEDKRGLIVITGISVSDAFSQQIEMPAGVYVTEIAKGGGAEKAGMTKGCIITAIDDITVDSMEALQEQLQYYEKGTTVTLKIQIPQTNGEYKEQTIEVTLQ